MNRAGVAQASSPAGSPGVSPDVPPGGETPPQPAKVKVEGRRKNAEIQTRGSRVPVYGLGFVISIRQVSNTGHRAGFIGENQSLHLGSFGNFHGSGVGGKPERGWRIDDGGWREPRNKRNTRTGLLPRGTGGNGGTPGARCWQRFCGALPRRRYAGGRCFRCRS